VLIQSIVLSIDNENAYTICWGLMEHENKRYVTTGQNNIPWRVANISTTISKYFTMKPSVLIPLVGGSLAPMVQGNKLQGGNFILRFHPKLSGIMGLTLGFSICVSLFILVPPLCGTTKPLWFSLSRSLEVDCRVPSLQNFLWQESFFFSSTWSLILTFEIWCSRFLCIKSFQAQKNSKWV